MFTKITKPVPKKSNVELIPLITQIYNTLT